IGPALGNRIGVHAGTAAELDDRTRRQLADAGEEVEAGTQPLIGEAKVLRGIPTHYDAASRSSCGSRLLADCPRAEKPGKGRRQHSSYAIRNWKRSLDKIPDKSKTKTCSILALLQ